MTHVSWHERHIQRPKSFASIGFTECPEGAFQEEFAFFGFLHHSLEIASWVARKIILQLGRNERPAPGQPPRRASSH